MMKENENENERKKNLEKKINKEIFFVQAETKIFLLHYHLLYIFKRERRL